jgi:hypothetical protein
MVRVGAAGEEITFVVVFNEIGIVFLSEGITKERLYIK